MEVCNQSIKITRYKNKTRGGSEIRKRTKTRKIQRKSSMKRKKGWNVSERKGKYIGRKRRKFFSKEINKTGITRRRRGGGYRSFRESKN